MPVELPYQGTTSVVLLEVEFQYQGTTSVVPLKPLPPQGFSPCMFRETISFSAMEEEEQTK